MKILILCCILEYSVFQNLLALVCKNWLFLFWNNLPGRLGMVWFLHRSFVDCTWNMLVLPSRLFFLLQRWVMVAGGNYGMKILLLWVFLCRMIFLVFLLLLRVSRRWMSSLFLHCVLWGLTCYQVFFLKVPTL